VLACFSLLPKQQKTKTEVGLMGSLKERLGEIEKQEILKALKKTNWVKARAARMLGITERMISYKIKKYGIKRKEVE
jgi:transcriptional regulator with GAF, ATPase, and Fis domain